MKRIGMLPSILMLMVILLTACAGNQSSTNIPSTNVATSTTEAKATKAAPSSTGVPSGTKAVSPTNGTTTPGIPVTGEENPARMSNQLEYTVWNKNGEQIGKVEDMVLNLDKASVSYVVVGTGGFLGLGEKKVLVPWNSLKLQAGTGNTSGGQKNAFILQANQDVYKNAPDVDIDSTLPKIGQPAGNWDKAIRSYWESGVLPATPSANATATATPKMTATPQSTATSTMKLQGVVLASKAVDASAKLQGQEDQKVDIKDIIVTPDSGKLQYVVVEANFDDGEHLIPVPLKALLWDPKDETIVINVDKATLQAAPSLQKDQYPDVTVSNWDRDFVKFWQNVKIGVLATPTP